jgi:hypothetical protein
MQHHLPTPGWDGPGGMITPPGSLSHPVGDLTQYVQPRAVAHAPIPPVSNDDRPGVGGDVDLLSQVAQGVEASGTLAIDPPEVLVLGRRVRARADRGGRTDPVPGDEPRSTPLRAGTTSRTERSRAVSRSGRSPSSRTPTRWSRGSTSRPTEHRAAPHALPSTRFSLRLACTVIALSLSVLCNSQPSSAGCPTAEREPGQAFIARGSGVLVEQLPRAPRTAQARTRTREPSGRARRGLPLFSSTGIPSLSRRPLASSPSTTDAVVSTLTHSSAILPIRT